MVMVMISCCVCSQLLLLNDLYSPEDISEHLLPVALALAEDKVAEVRLVAYKVVSKRGSKLCIAQLSHQRKGPLAKGLDWVTASSEERPSSWGIGLGYFLSDKRGL